MARLVVGLGLLATVVLVAIAALGFWLWSLFTAPSAANPDRPPPPHERPTAVEGATLTRAQRRQLEADLLEVERRLEFALGQARAMGAPDQRAAWADEATSLRRRRDEILARLGR